MKILMAGASGLIGKVLATALSCEGHEIITLVRSRRPLSPQERFWEPANGHFDPQDLKGIEAVINLAGENIAAGRWTEARKQRLLESRIRSTQLLAATLAKLPQPPQLLINASAVGFYGDRGDEILTEESASGPGFLAEVCRQWEAATEPAQQAGIRVIKLRLGMVLAREGGALAQMLNPFKWGLGGTIGSGNQYMSWIAIDELARLVQHCLATPALQGPVNAVAPHPVTNREFTQTLGALLHRPTLLPLPAFAVKLLFGELGQELLLSSSRVLPEQLKKTGYAFAYPDLKSALKQVLS